MFWGPLKTALALGVGRSNKQEGGEGRHGGEKEFLAHPQIITRVSFVRRDGLLLYPVMTEVTAECLTGSDKCHKKYR